MAFCRNFGKKRNKNEERHPKLIVALTTQAENGNADVRCRLTNPQNSIIMPRIKKHAEKFGGRGEKCVPLHPLSGGTPGAQRKRDH